MHKRILGFIPLLLVCYQGVVAQSTDAKTSCSCTELMQETILKIEDNYLGYHIAIKRHYEAAYLQHKKQFLNRAAGMELDNCLALLQAFLKFFKDGHLFIGMRPKLSAEKKEMLSQQAEKYSKTEEELLSYFTKKSDVLDPIEGIWYDQSGAEYGIFKDDKNPNRDFVAIVLASESENWQVGQVKATFIKNLDDSYDVLYYNQDHYPIPINIYEDNKQGGAHLRRGSMLHLPPYTWGKKLPIKWTTSNRIDPKDPRAPLLEIIDEETVLISIPSHVPTYAKSLEKLVKGKQKILRSSQTLIIDIRGNEGGSSWITNVLLPFIEGRKTKKPRYYEGDQTYVLSSPENIKYFEKAEQQGWLPKGLMSKLQDNPGAILAFEEEAPATTENETENSKSKVLPKQVAILIGEGTVSAAEAFVLKVMSYEKVTLFGQATSGVIDYQSVSMSLLNTCSEMQYYLGRPMFAASNRLPEGGVNKTGIIPDVIIPKAIKDKIGFILEYYKE